MRWLALLVCLLFLPGVAAQSYTTEMKEITSHDGITINARLYTPAATPAPTILLTHGWNGDLDKSETVRFAQRYAEAGYNVLAYDSRGWGKSGGDVELNGPNEVKDAQALITYLAGLDTVVLDGEGDPRIGMIGQSYAGGIQLLTAQVDPRIDAIAPFATWSNLQTSLAPNDVIKRGWVDLLFVSGQFSSRGAELGETDPAQYDPNPSGPMADLTRWYAELVATNEISDEVRKELGEVRSLTPNTLTTPTFLVQGWPDTLFTPDQALATYYDLRNRGVDVRIGFVDGGHGFGGYSPDGVMVYVDDFFAQYLQDELPSVAPYPVIRYRYAEADFVGDLQWPPAGTTAGFWYLTDDGLSTSAGPLEQTLMVPPVPGYCTEVANFQDEAASICGRGLNGTYHTFASTPLDAAQEVTGAGQVAIPIKSTQTDEVFLFFQLVDVAADGSETTVLAQVQPFRAPAGTSMASVYLPAVSHTFEKGHSIGLKVTTTDLSFHGAREPGQVDLTTGAMMVLPLTAKDAHGDRSKPALNRISSFGQALETEGNDTQVLRVEVRDNLAIQNVSVVGDGATVTVEVSEATAKYRLLTITAKAPVCDVGIVTVKATDFEGNNATSSYAVVPCPPVEEPPIAPEEKTKKSPGGWLVLPLLGAAFLRRRWA